MTKEMIREWMNQNNHSRQWLANRCGVTLKTVNNWLSSERAVPAKAFRIIETLMEEEHRKVAESKPRLVLDFTKEEFDRICAAALKESLTVTQWAETKLKELSSAKVGDLKKQLKSK